jgi:WD40 repeat protein
MLLAYLLPATGAAIPNRAVGVHSLQPLQRMNTYRPGHAAVISGLSVSPDGAHLASANFDEALTIWDWASGRALRHLNQQRRLLTVAYSPDGGTLASAGWDGMLHVWEAATGRHLREWRGAADRVGCLDFSPNGKYLASGGPEAPLTLWEAASGKEIHRLSGRTFVLAFEPSGTKLAACSYSDASVQFWDVETGEPRQQLRKPAAYLAQLVFSPDGRMLVTGGFEGQLVVWEVATATERLRFQDRRSAVTSLAFSPDGALLVSGHADGLLHAWDPTTGRECGRLAGHQERQPVRAVVFAPTGNRVASGSEDMQILIWDVGPLLGRNRESTASTPGRALATLWKDLASEDAQAAYRAVLDLANRPEQSVPFLQEQALRLRELQDRLAQLVTQLDDRRFVVRRKAARELERLGQEAQTVLRAALTQDPSLEVRRRIDWLLEQLPPRQRFALSGVQARLYRSVEILERIGSAAARQTLTLISRDGPEVPLRQEAKAALARLDKSARSRDGDGTRTK